MHAIVKTCMCIRMLVHDCCSDKTHLGPNIRVGLCLLCIFSSWLKLKGQIIAKLGALQTTRFS